MTRRLMWACALAWCACLSPVEKRLAAGQEHARVGRWLEAERDFRAAVEREPQSVLALELQGLALWELRRPNDAEQVFLRAQSLNPQRETVLVGLARIQLFKQKPDAALELLTTATSPQSAAWHQTCAEAYLARGHGDDAQQALAQAQQARALDSNDASVDYVLGSAYLAASQWGEASATFSALQAAHPNSELGAYGLARLAAAQSHQIDALFHLSHAKAVAGSRWNALQVRADPAFEWLHATPEFQALTEAAKEP